MHHLTVKIIRYKNFDSTKALRFFPWAESRMAVLIVVFIMKVKDVIFNIAVRTKTFDFQNREKQVKFLKSYTHDDKQNCTHCTKINFRLHYLMKHLQEFWFQYSLYFNIQYSAQQLYQSMLGWISTADYNELNKIINQFSANVIFNTPELISTPEGSMKSPWNQKV